MWSDLDHWIGFMSVKYFRIYIIPKNGQKLDFRFVIEETSDKSSWELIHRVYHVDFNCVNCLAFCNVKPLLHLFMIVIIIIIDGNVVFLL